MVTEEWILAIGHLGRSEARISLFTKTEHLDIATSPIMVAKVKPIETECIPLIVVPLQWQGLRGKIHMEHMPEVSFDSFQEASASQRALRLTTPLDRFF